jgi:hypothetical protein
MILAWHVTGKRAGGGRGNINKYRVLVGRTCRKEITWKT